jgi:hypothetical protein
MSWSKIEVYNHGKFIGSFYTNETTKDNVIADINLQYGKGKWTNYNIGN